MEEQTSLWRNPKKAVVVVAEVAMVDLLLVEMHLNISRRKTKVPKVPRQPRSSQALSRTGTPAVATISRLTKV